MTATTCTQCGRAIPYDQPRVRLQFVTGSTVTAWKEVCVRWCVDGANGEALISAGMSAAALKMHQKHPGMAKVWGGQRR